MTTFVELLVVTYVIIILLTIFAEKKIRDSESDD